MQKRRRRQIYRALCQSDFIVECGVRFEWIEDHAIFPHWRRGNVLVFEPAQGMPDWLVYGPDGTPYRFTGQTARQYAFRIAAELSDA